MPNDPPRDPIERPGERALAGDLPTGDVAKLAGDPSDPERTVIRGSPAGTEPTLVSPGGAPPAAAHDIPAGRPFGRYVLLEELGHGGMGVVWKAYDTQLRRIVALKGMIAEEFADASQVERFMREARSAARLSHPNIIPVHDVGEHEGQHYFTTEFIEARPLDVVMESPVPVKQALAWVKSIAEALAYAHQQGIVHRDVKPANVLIDKDGRPHVMDFGLAKHVDAEGSKSGPALTLSGDLLGTPRYMSPEQTRGAVGAGAASDQFSLGVVLYELLTGRPPFDGGDMRSLLDAIAEREPVRPTQVNARLHRDIETICLKTLEKDPARRYASMGDLAADIGRWDDGEPIRARPVGAASRLARRVRKHPLVSGLVAAVVLALALAGLLASKRAGERAEAARERDRLLANAVEQLRVMGDALVDASLARRALGDLPGSDRYAELLWPAVRKLKEQAPAFAEPWYHEGRMLRAQQKNEEAERSQDEAVRLARRPDATSESRALLGAALYERGVLRMMRWQALMSKKRTALLQARSAGTRPEDPAPEPVSDEEVAAACAEVGQLRALAEKDLREASGMARRPDESTAAAAISAALQGDAEAEALLRRALAQDPFSVELHNALAAIAERHGDPVRAAAIYEEAHQADRGYWPHLLHEASAFRCAAEADPSRSDEFLGRALEAARAALTLFPRCPAALSEACVILFAQGHASWRAGDERKAEGAYEAALQASEAWASVLPGSPEVLVDQALLHHSLGDARLARGEDPSAEYEQALAGIRKALSIAPSAEAAVDEANVLQSLGELKHSHGEDPSIEYQQAWDGCARALSLNPRSASAANTQGVTCTLRATVKRERGADPSVEYARALDCYQKALSLDPRFAAAANNEANVHQELGDLKLGRGEDPSAEYREALARYDRVLSLDPRCAAAAYNRAYIHHMSGNEKRAHGGDPSGEYRKALEGYDQALSLNPRFFVAANNQALVYQLLGDAKRERGEDPAPEYQHALDRFRVALSANPTAEATVLNLANLHQTLGDAMRTRGEDPSGEYRQALEGYDRALELAPRDARPANNQGNIHKSQGDARRERGEDASAEYQAALAAYDKALSLNPGYAEAAYNRATVHSSLAESKSGRGEDPTPEYQEALAGYEKALSLNPRLAEAMNSAADMYGRIGQGKRERGEDASDEFQKALAGYEKALTMNPGLWQAHTNRGLLLEQTGRLREAVREYEAALAIVKDGYPQLKEWLARARAAAERAAPTEDPPRH